VTPLIFQYINGCISKIPSKASQIYLDVDFTLSEHILETQNLNLDTSRCASNLETAIVLL